MRILPLCAASALTLPASAQSLRERPSAATSSIVIVQNGSVQAFDADAALGMHLIADAVDSVTIAIAICDGAGRPIANLPVRIDLTGSRNIVTPDATSFTDVNGLFIANLTTTAAETKTIFVTADPGPAEVRLQDQPSVTFRAGPAVRFEVVPGASKAVARDFFGNVAGTVGLEAWSTTHPEQ